MVENAYDPSIQPKEVLFLNIIDRQMKLKLVDCMILDFSKKNFLN